MTDDRMDIVDSVSASVFSKGLMAESLGLRGVYSWEHYRAGKLIGSGTFENLVVTVGKNLVLDNMLGSSSFTPVVRMGLKGTGTVNAADTQASHAGWSEVGLANAPAYSGGRKSPSFSAASGGSKATSANVSFGMTSSGTVAGAFINMNGSATVDDTTGTLFSAGDFSGGSRTVSNGDTINVGYTLAA
jgi:hypothetical protein